LRVAIAGGHGKIGRLLIRSLVARGDEVASIDRNPAYGDELRAWGAEPVVCDLESAPVGEVGAALGSAEAVVFSAGAGPGSGSERKWTMDHGGAVKLIEAARSAGIDRYVMVSSIGADPGAEGEDTFAVYLRAKGSADAELEASGLDHTVVRPSRLTDEEATGLVEIAEHVERRPVSRGDVAAVLAAVLTAPNTSGRRFELTSGSTPVAEAVAAI
jgi:uncharacterized protein YbjT (DUF2867 family)